MQTTNSHIKITKYFDKIFLRNNLDRPFDIIKWWNKGRFLLNVIILLFSLLHLLIMLFVFKNGFIILLIPIIFWLVLLVNIIYSLGMIFELIVKFVLHHNLQMNYAYSVIKKLQFLLSILLVLSLAVYGIFVEPT